MALVTTIRIDRLAELEAKERRLCLLEEWTNRSLMRAFERFYRNRVGQTLSEEEADAARSRQERDQSRA